MFCAEEVMVIDDGICAFCAKSRVIRAIFSFLLVTAVVVTSFTPVLSVKDFVAALASYGCVVSAAARSLRVALASRVMAVHLCGELRVKSAIPALEKICAAPGTSEILRRSAGCALSRIR